MLREEPKDYTEGIYPDVGYCPLFIICHNCGESKPTSNYIKKTGKGNLVLKKSCDNCRNKINESKNLAIEATRLLSLDSNYDPNFKICAKCGILKPITNFSPRRTNKQGITIRSITCRSCSVQGGGTGMTKEKKLKVLKRDSYVCHYCGAYGDTVDHVIPMSKGGRNALSNLVCACEKCNRERGNMDYERYVAFKKQSTQ
ncbi:HNH endonuclease [Paenibacillus sp. NPDC057886]|uniref:HNH endonuclease n=1 Tax=Paenibacillus sp. NPDC057886 TaxID=3346270 RepID=UPI0036AD8A20